MPKVNICVKSLWIHISFLIPAGYWKRQQTCVWGATMTRSKEGLWWEQNPAVKEEVEEKKILLVLSWVLLSIALIGTTQCGPRKQPSCFIYNSTIPMIFARVLDFPFFVKNTSHMCFPLWWICSGIANSGNLWLSWKFTHGPVLPLPQLHFFFHSKHWNK